MQVQKINNSQPFVKNKSNNNACETKSLHNVSFGAYGEELIQRLISKQGKRSPIKELLRRPHINPHTNIGKLELFQRCLEYVHEFSRSRFYKPNIYIGSSFYDNIGMAPSDHINANFFMSIAAKKAGIKTIIDLDGTSGLKENVEKNGLKYYSYPIWTYALGDTYGAKKEQIKDRLVDFIKEMQKDNIYICSHTVTPRDIAAMINTWFNPKFIRGSARVSRDGAEVASIVESFIKDMYPLITEKDKKSIGWTPEFEKRFNEKLKLIK